MVIVLQSVMLLGNVAPSMGSDPQGSVTGGAVCGRTGSSKSNRESYVGTGTIHGLFSNSNQPAIRALLLWLAC